MSMPASHLRLVGVPVDGSKPLATRILFLPAGPGAGNAGVVRALANARRPGSKSPRRNPRYRRPAPDESAASAAMRASRCSTASPGEDLWRGGSIADELSSAARAQVGGSAGAARAGGQAGADAERTRCPRALHGRAPTGVLAWCARRRRVRWMQTSVCVCWTVCRDPGNLGLHTAAAAPSAARRPADGWVRAVWSPRVG